MYCGEFLAFVSIVMWSHNKNPDSIPMPNPPVGFSQDGNLLKFTFSVLPLHPLPILNIASSPLLSIPIPWSIILTVQWESSFGSIFILIVKSLISILLNVIFEWLNL